MKTRQMLYLDAFKASLDLMQAHVAHQTPRHLDNDATRISRQLVTTCRIIRDSPAKDETPDADD